MLSSRRIAKVLVIACAFHAVGAHAGVQQQWVARYDALGPDTQGAARQVLVDADGSARILGDYAGLLVARFDSDGNMLWDMRLAGRGVGASYPWGGPTRAASMDQAGVLYVPDTAGRLLQIDANGAVLADVDLSALFGTAFATVGTALHPDGGLVVAGNVNGATTGGDVLVARLDASLQPVWIQVLDRAGRSEAGAALRVTPQGIFVAGSSDGALVVWALDAAGTPTREVTGPLMSVAGFDVDAAGGFAVEGSDLYQDATTLSWSSTGILYVDRYDATGQLLWSVTEPSVLGISGGPVRIADDGTVYVGAASNPNSTMPGYDLRAYSADGKLAWERRYAPYGDSFIYDLVLDRGQPIATGEYGYCYGQIGTMKHSAAGDLLWFAGYNPPQNGCGSVNYGYSLALDARRNVYVTGFTYDAVNSIGHYPYKPTLLKYAQVDTAAPVTTATAHGTAGAGGWFVSPLTVTLVALDAADEASGVGELRWWLDGGAEVVVPGAQVSVAVSGDGVHTLTFGAVDVAGNAEAVQAVTYAIDGTPPAVTVAVSPTTVPPGAKRRQVRVTGTASDATSGLADVVVRVTDPSGALVAVTAFESSVTLPAKKGVYTFTATSSDAAGNSASAVATVTAD